MKHVKFLRKNILFKIIFSLLVTITIFLLNVDNAFAKPLPKKSLDTQSLSQPSSAEKTLANIDSNFFDDRENLLGLWFFPSRARTAGGKASRTRALGSRGKCSTSQSTLIALVPPIEDPHEQTEHGNSRQDALGYSLEESPTIWFFLSDPPEALQSAEFMIQEYNPESRQYIDVSDPIQFSLTRNGGGHNKISSALVGFNLGDAGIRLDANKDYHWYISLICQEEGDRRRPSREANINSWVVVEEVLDERERQELRVLKQDTSLEGYKNILNWYIDKGIWYDSLDILERLKNGFNDSEMFISVLNSIGFQQSEEIVSQPIYRVDVYKE